MPDLEIVFLGTASAIPTKDRNHSSVYMRYRSDRFLLDCGEGTQRQLTLAGLSGMKIDHVLLSHLHGDHFFGLPGMLTTSLMRERKEPLVLYGPRGLKEALKVAMEFAGFGKGFPVKAVESRGGELVRGKGYSISCFPVEHGPPSLGFVFQEEGKSNIDEDALRKIGLTPGPVYGQLKAGKAVKWKGKTLKPSDFVTAKPGVKVVYSGDTAPCKQVAAAAKDADLLIHEATFGDELADKAREFGHSTATDAAKAAKKAGAKRLILTHFSNRYDDVAALVEEARKVFPSAEAAADLMRVTL
jgi:ribonuclease Z